MTGIKIKERLISLVIEQLNAQIEGLEEGRARNQAEAKEHVNEYGSMYDNAKEVANAMQAGILKQIQKIDEVLTAMHLIIPKKSEAIEPGCVIVAGNDAYFVSTGLIEKPLNVGGVEYTCVNITAPIVQKLRQKAGTTIF